MTDYEKLGVFYLGKEHDLAKGKRLDEAVLYKSKDLTTHAVIIGMTGSGKTGLAMGILEEALIDKIPIIAIDPKGDIPNLMLTFPELRASDFRPWIDEQEAARKGQTPDQYAGAQAGLWRKGIGSWDQGPDRIRKLKEAAEVTIYTPGSYAGKPINVLRQFSPPAREIRDDRDLLRERILNTVNGLLSLLEIEADPITSPEHILLANILERAWAEGTSMDLAGLIGAIQNPPFQRVGVLDLDLFFPPQKRLGLAMRINNLLASPGFEAWMTGDPLDVTHLLHTAEGKPRASIFSIAHLSDAERMFFVALLLNEVVGWMRMQSGTGSLRALLYMDEIFGFFPPVKNPPAKAPLLTLLKQARAMGLGVVLATQNPVDLDYKGLSNTGTWFIGRLQTDRDKQRVQAGLEGAAPASGLNSKKTSDLLSRLGKRVFLLHNVHEAQPRLFQTRWVLSYLRGPVTRNQIKKLMSDQKIELKPVKTDTAAIPTSAASPERQTRPPDPRGVDVFFAAPSGAGHGVIYRPTALGKLDVHFSSARYGVDDTQSMTVATTLESGPIPLDWDRSFELLLDLQNLGNRPVSDATFDALPKKALKGTPFKKWQKDLLRWICQNRPITLWRHSEFKMTSRQEESERQFLARLAHKAREDRDLATEKLQKKFLSKFEKLERKYQKAQQVLARESSQVRSGELDTMMSMGTAVLGAFLGGRRRSSSRLRSAARSASRMRKEKMDVTRAQAVADSVRHELNALEMEFDDALAQVQYTPDPGREALEPILIKPKTTQMTVELFALIWLPYREDVDGTLSPDW